MTELPITRSRAIELLKSISGNGQSEMNHYLESEAIMRKLAEVFGEDEDYWGMLGLLHDVDWGLTKEDVEKHLTLAPEILKKEGFDDAFIQRVVSHGYGFKELPNLKDKKREEKIEHSLSAAETLTGLVHAYALMRGKMISDMKVSGLKKKFKDKAFAAGCNRDIIREIEETGISLDEFFQLAIDAMKSIKSSVGLE